MSPEKLNSFVTVCYAVLYLIGSCLSENAPYTLFAKDATLAEPVEYYDYIIVGGGTSGCALAATLSQGAKILMLERGGLPYGDPNIENIDGFAATLVDVSPTSAAQPFISTDGVFNHRPLVLGGGTALNAGFYSRASSAYVSRAGWDKRLVNESYEWVEKKVVFRPSLLAWQSAVRDGLLEADVLPYNGFTYDHLIGTKIGGTIFDESGHRHTAADLLEYADPTKTRVYLYATVQKILFLTEGQPRPRAHGVIYKDSRGNEHMAYLNGDNSMNEIILSAGALGSPQLLMLSGIGPSKHLMDHKIRVLLDQPMVGQGMADNPLNTLIIPSPRPVETSLVQAVGITSFCSFIEASSGRIQLDLLQRFAENFQNLANQLGLKVNLPVNLNNISTLFKFDVVQNNAIQAGFIGEMVSGPFSTGHLELKNTDPNDNPQVTFNYFKDPRDLERCVKGMEVVLKVIDSKSFEKFRYPFTSTQSYVNLIHALPFNLRLRHLSRTVSIEQFCIDTVMTIWHYHGGCQVDKVVNHDYKVIGADALRVVDGSTFQDSPGTNPQATVMMLGRYMGQRILQERASR